MSDDFNKVRFRVQVDGKPGGVVLDWRMVKDCASRDDLKRLVKAHIRADPDSVQVSGADLDLAWGRVDEGRRVW